MPFLKTLVNTVLNDEYKSLYATLETNSVFTVHDYNFEDNIILCSTGVNACNVIVIKTTKGDLYAMSHLQPPMGNMSTGIFIDDTENHYKKLLSFFTGKNVQVFVIANYWDRNLFEKICNFMNINIEDLIYTSHENLFSTDNFGYNISRFTLCSDNKIENVQHILKVRNVNICYNILYDSLIIHGDCYTNTNKPAFVFAPNIFQTKMVNFHIIDKNLSMTHNEPLIDNDFEKIHPFLPILFIVADKFSTPI